MYSERGEHGTDERLNTRNKLRPKIFPPHTHTHIGDRADIGAQGRGRDYAGGRGREIVGMNRRVLPREFRKIVNIREGRARKNPIGPPR